PSPLVAARSLHDALPIFGGETTYALEGSIFMAGAIVQWLRDEMKLIGSSADSEKMAREANPNSHAVLVPAFTGLGAPYWEPAARDRKSTRLNSSHVKSSY